MDIFPLLSQHVLSDIQEQEICVGSHSVMLVGWRTKLAQMDERTFNQ